MKRWNQSLRGKLELIERHIEYLVIRLIYNAKRAKKIQAKLEKQTSPELQDKLILVYEKLYEIVHDLSCVEEQVLQRYPYIEELYFALKTTTTINKDCNA